MEENRINDIDTAEDADILKGKSPLRRFILGVLIGLAVIAPGVSGSTIAIILGLYTAMLYANGHLFTDFKRSIRFLFPLGVGTIVGFLAGFLVIREIFGDYVFQMVFLFAGLMAGAFPALTRQIKGGKPNALRLSLMIVGILLPIAISLIGYFFLEEAPTEGTFTNFPIGRYFAYLPLGFLVSITQVVPGLSATAILMAFGQFGLILNSVHKDFILENPQVLLLYLSLAIGFFGGTFLLSRLLSGILEKHKVTSFYMIVGLSFGSIISMFLSSDMFSVYNSWSLPGAFSPIGFVIALALFAIGFVVSYVLVLYEKKHNIAVS